MTRVEQLAAFVARACYKDLSEEASRELKIHVLDALGCAIGAIEGPPIRMLRLQFEDFGGNPLVTLIGGGKTAPDRAAFYNSALVRYPDYNDSYLAEKETCHPSDNLGAVLAASEYAKRSGKAFLTALAVAYQVQCRLSDVAPVRAKGFDHTTQGAYAVAAGVAKALCLTQEQTAHAVAISGTANNALRITRTGRLSHWKGLAYPNTAFDAIHASFLAMRGITGPLEVFEGNKGFMEAIAGPFEIDWQQEILEVVRHTSIKQYNAEFHSQSALEGVLELKAFYQVRPGEIERIEIEIFDVAYHIIGGGEEGDKYHVRTKEEADHSLPYLLAVALLDGQVTPAQFEPERILRPDVQSLLRMVAIHPDAGFSARFPREMPAHVSIALRDGEVLEREVSAMEPPGWSDALQKLELLAAGFTTAEQRAAIAETIARLERIQLSELMNGLAGVGRSRVRPSAA